MCCGVCRCGASSPHGTGNDGYHIYNVDEFAVSSMRHALSVRANQSFEIFVENQLRRSAYSFVECRGLKIKYKKAEKNCRAKYNFNAVQCRKVSKEIQ